MQNDKQKKTRRKIAESKDPVIRKQLQELLDLRNKRSKQRKDKVVNFVKKLNPPDTRTKEEKKRDVLFGVAIGIGFILFMIFIIILFS